MDTMLNQQHQMESRMTHLESRSRRRTAEQGNVERGNASAHSVRGYAYGVSTETTCVSWTTRTVADLTIATSPVATVSRAPKAAVKGHLAFAAIVPGSPAWSPPTC